jgi:O-antigen/teichoic acid export membrane protein
MNREFLLNAGLLLAVNLVIKPVYIFGIDRTVQNTVGSETYGLYFALFNLSLLFQMLNDFGIQNFNSRNLSMHRHLLYKYLPNLLQIKFLLALLYSAVLFGSAVLLGYQSPVWPLLLLLGFNQILNALLLYLRSNVLALGYYRLDSLLSALDRSLLIALMAVLLWGPWRDSFQILWFAGAQTVSLLLSVFVVGILVFRKLPTWQVRWRPLFLLALLRASLPYALIALLMSLYTRMDAVMLERLLSDGAREAGIYAGAYRLLDAAAMLGYLVAGLLLPMFARLNHQQEAQQSLLKLSTQLLFVAAIGLSAAVCAFRHEITTLLYTEADPYWGQVLGSLIWSIVGLFGGYTFGTLLLVKGKLRALNILFSGSLLLNLALNLWLIPRWGALGAVAATLATQVLVLGAEVVLSHRVLHMSPGALQPLRLLLLVGILIPCAFVLQTWELGHWALRSLAIPLLAAVLGRILVVRGQ